MRDRRDADPLRPLPRRGAVLHRGEHSASVRPSGRMGGMVGSHGVSLSVAGFQDCRRVRGKRLTGGVLPPFGGAGLPSGTEESVCRMARGRGARPGPALPRGRLRLSTPPASARADWDGPKSGGFVPSPALASRALRLRRRGPGSCPVIKIWRSQIEESDCGRGEADGHVPASPLHFWARLRPRAPPLGSARTGARRGPGALAVLLWRYQDRSSPAPVRPSLRWGRERQERARLARSWVAQRSRGACRTGGSRPETVWQLCGAESAELRKGAGNAVQTPAPTCMAPGGGFAGRNLHSHHLAPPPGANRADWI